MAANHSQSEGSLGMRLTVVWSDKCYLALLGTLLLVIPSLPLPFSFFKDSFQLYIEVFDYDPIFPPDDHVDDVYIVETLSPSSSFTSETWYTGVNGSSEIRLSFRVQCDATFYGSDCATYCVDTDVNGVGHYTCDFNGQKICLSGWTDANYNCLTRKKLKEILVLWNSLTV